MQVNRASAVADRSSYLYKWDSAVRQNYQATENAKIQAKDGLQRLFKNPLTRVWDPIVFRGRFQNIDSAVLRQQLGTISGQEVAELNAVLGKESGYSYKKKLFSQNELRAYNKNINTAIALCSTSAVVYFRFVAGYNMLWFVAPFTPLVTYIAYQMGSQPKEQLNSCYRYLLAKRAATCEHEKNAKKFKQNEFTKTAEYR